MGETLEDKPDSEARVKCQQAITLRCMLSIGFQLLLAYFIMLNDTDSRSKFISESSDMRGKITNQTLDCKHFLC